MSDPPPTSLATGCCKLVLASGNRHKLEELRRALPGFDVEPLGRDDAPPEDGATFADNARGKALWGRGHTGGGAWALGEDSGLEVAALGGGPGVLTARWAGGEHVPRVLAALEHEDDRRARYVCVLVAIAPDGLALVAEGALEGVIARAPAGSAGFGFDPVFVPDGEDVPVAVLGDGWKDAHSHRARAARRLADLLLSASTRSRAR